eukprot:707571-Amorphochlora_amoeboformis.AAC.1
MNEIEESRGRTRVWNLGYFCEVSIQSPAQGELEKLGEASDWKLQCSTNITANSTISINL